MSIYRGVFTAGDDLQGRLELSLGRRIRRRSFQDYLDARYRPALIIADLREDSNSQRAEQRDSSDEKLIRTHVA